MKTDRLQSTTFSILLAVLFSWLTIAVSAQTAHTDAANGASSSAPTAPGPGKGTVTSVGLSAPASEFLVTGSPVTSSGTLGLSWNIPPTDSNTASAIVKRRSDGGFDAGGTINAGDIQATIVNASVSLNSPYITGRIVATGDGSDWAVEGTQTSGSSAAIYGSTGNASTGPGVQGVGYSGYGVYGYSSTNDGVHGQGLTGVAGSAFTGGDGVYG
jgi:hypothetical protein